MAPQRALFDVSRWIIERVPNVVRPSKVDIRRFGGRTSCMSAAGRMDLQLAQVCAGECRYKTAAEIFHG